MRNILLIGYKKPIQLDDIPDVDIKDSAEYLNFSFDDSIRQVKEKDGTTNPSIYKAIYLFARKKAAINALFAVINASASYVGPYLITDFVNFLTEKESRGVKSGYLLSLGFLCAKMVETIAQRQWIFGARQLGLRLRAALISHIYKKGLHLSSRSRQSHSGGEIMNYMSVDVQRITDFVWYVNVIWMLPIQISLAVFILHTNLGLGSLAALAATLAVMTLNIPLTKIQKRYQTKIMDAKDNRMKATSEILKNMRTLKLQSWDSEFFKRIESLRNVEYGWLLKSLRQAAFSAFIFWGSPTFISVITFWACMFLGIELTAGRVLSAFATFRMLQDPIFSLPDLLNVMAQGKVSVDRIASFLKKEEIQHDECLMGILKEKTILFVTHQVEFLPAADLILIASNYWMAWVCPTTSDAKPIYDMNFILLIYMALSVAGSFCVLLRAMLVLNCGLWTAQTFFTRMLHNVQRAPMSFFDSTPTGRILNRASTDQSVLDMEMANKIGWCAFSIIQILGTIAVMCQAAWQVFIIFIPVTGICIWYQALDKCQLGHLVRAKEEKLDSPGRIAEYDEPSKLLEREDSFFYKLIKEYSSRSHSFNNLASQHVHG
ncbi:hypothetical protein TSUD_353490 [Trifolium subterraneum]|uniref:ABC transmembrane type-1 domain-containing protein n=1 Tax=Trifolium subterraneum TaxID=3900 RepID=A0A2Z6NK40_TRISU|nr:hypothetical protein TSUD_353490 [Trifolium subterraneum]